jgi:hypothetical protein
LKTVIVLDTDFIRHVGNDNLPRAVELLSAHGEVYIPQIAKDERVSQDANEIARNYNNARDFIAKQKEILTASFKIKEEDRLREKKEILSKLFADCFGERVIPIPKDQTLFSKIYGRAITETAPFAPNKDGKSQSDNGFKDTILWLSLLDFTKKVKQT